MVHCWCATSSHLEQHEILFHCLPLDVECFINVIEDRPPWDSRCADYANRLKKQECWNEVCGELKEDFDALSKAPFGARGTLGILIFLRYTRIRVEN
jgi:hypothetical protein